MLTCVGGNIYFFQMNLVTNGFSGYCWHLYVDMFDTIITWSLSCQPVLSKYLLHIPNSLVSNNHVTSSRMSARCTYHFIPSRLPFDDMFPVTGLAIHCMSIHNGTWHAYHVCHLFPKTTWPPSTAYTYIQKYLTSSLSMPCNRDIRYHCPPSDCAIDYVSVRRHHSPFMVSLLS